MPPHPIEQAIHDRARDLLDTEDPVNVSVEASSLIIDLRDEPDFTAWADAIVYEMVTTRLRHHLASIRTTAMRDQKTTRRRSVFSAAISEEETASPLDVRYALPGQDSLWLRLGSMKRPELLSVAQHRHTQAHSNWVEAMFLRALADSLPDDDTPVDAVLDDDQVRDLHSRAADFTFPPAAPPTVRHITRKRATTNN